MNFSMNLTCMALGALVVMPIHGLAQTIPPLSVCSGAVEVAACEAERGDRAGAQGVSGRWRLGRRLPIAPANAGRFGGSERSIPARHLPRRLGSSEGRT